jgi:beta-hydroxylase
MSSAAENRAFYDVDEFPLLADLTGKWLAIREEFLALHAPVMPLHRFGKTYRQIGEEIQAYLEQGGEFGWVTGWGKHGANPAWIQYPLVAFGMAPAWVKDAMPLTLELLRPIPGIQTCALVTLKAGGSLHCHHHPEFREHGLLLLHLTLDAAAERNYAYLNVAGQWRQHTPGGVLVFDGAEDHFVVNESPVDRTILYLEFYHQELAGRRTEPSGAP